MKRITLLLAEDQTLVRQGFRRMLELEPDFQVVGEAANGREAIALTRKKAPDIVLMEITMPSLDGLETTRRIIKTAPATKVLILTARSDDEHLAGAIASGARGFVTKRASAKILYNAIREVHKGNNYYCPLISKRFARLGSISFARACAQNKPSRPLSTREIEVLRLVADGLATKQIAADLGIGVKTVEKHRQHLMRKLDIHDIASLTRYAVGAGIV